MQISSCLCNVCHQRSTVTDPLVRCAECGLVVHRFCYGVTEFTTPWICYPCQAKEKNPICVICMKSTSDAYIHFGSGTWCHVLCSELIQQTQFLNNNMILSHLLLAFSAEGLQIPQTISAQKRLISTTKIYCILPSNIVVINPPQSFPNYKLICSICNKEINGRFVQCCFDPCSFRAHPICLGHRERQEWGFIVDNRNPCGLVRIACSNHITRFNINQYSISRSFPQISSLCFRACEIVLPSILQQESLSLQLYQPSSIPTQPSQTVVSTPVSTPAPAPQVVVSSSSSVSTRSSHSHSNIANDEYIPPKSRAGQYERKHTRVPPAIVTTQVPQNPVRVKEESQVPKKKYNKGSYPVQDFIHDIEYHYFTPKQQKFWLFYKTVDGEPTFKEVNPIASPLIKVNDYITQRNVLYEYHRNDQMIPIADNYKIVKLLLQTHVTGEITFMIFQNSSSQFIEHAQFISQDLIDESNRTTKSRIVFKQQNHGEFDTVNYMDFELPSNLEAIILDERVLISDHCIAGGANDPIAFEIRNLTKAYHNAHQQNWSIINTKLNEMNNDNIKDIKQVSEDLLSVYIEQLRWEELQQSVRQGLCDSFSSITSFVNYLNSSPSATSTYLQVQPTCAICFAPHIVNPSLRDENPLIECRVCHIQVHTKCIGYHGDYWNDGFICDACEHLANRGDPTALYCCYCYGVDGYLRKIHSPTTPRFAHILCSLFSPGSEITNFTDMKLAADGLTVNYEGLTLYSPLTLINDEASYNLYVSRIPQLSEFYSKQSLSVPIFTIPQKSLYSKQIDCSFAPKSTLHHIHPVYNKPIASTMVTFYSQSLGTRNRINYNVSNQGMSTRLRDEVMALHIADSTLHSPTGYEYEESHDLALPGGLCCYCLCPRGVTIRCSSAKCTKSYHFYCHIMAGGYVSIPKINKQYVGGGKGVSFVTYCKTHELCRNNSSQLSQVLLRNASRFKQSMNNNTPKVLLQTHCPSLWTEATKVNTETNTNTNTTETNTTKANTTNTKSSSQNETPSISNRFTDLCSVCGYGYYAPPMNYDISLEENQFGKAIRLNSLRTPAQSRLITRNSKITYKLILNQWEELTSFSGKDSKKSFLIEGSRGRMIKCCCCDCVIHEKCLDCPSYHILSTDSQFAYIICPNCLLGLNAGYKLHHKTHPSYKIGECAICGLTQGFMVLTINGQWVHKRCALLLRNSIYNSKESYFSKAGISSPADAANRTLVQFAIPSSECFGLVSNDLSSGSSSYSNRKGISCHVCGKQTGRFVKCSMNDCHHYFHLSCLDRRSCYYASTAEGLEVLCPSHLPANFVQDPLSLIWLPANCVNIIVLLMQQQQIIQLCLDSMKMLVDKSKADIEKIKGMIPSMFNEIGIMKEKVKNYIQVKEDGFGLSIQRIAMANWTCKTEGISYMEPIMNECTRVVGDKINDIKLQAYLAQQKQAEEAAAVAAAVAAAAAKAKAEEEAKKKKEPVVAVPKQPIVKSPEVTPKSPTTTVKAKEEVKKNKPTLSHSSSTSSHHQHHSEDEDDEEVFFDDLEMSTRDRKDHRVNYSRVVTSSTYNKMCVHRDDLIITSKRLHHRNHQIFINVTRLQELIRNEGKRVETDPFIKYVSNLDESHFINDKQFDKVLIASQNMRGIKRSSASTDTDLPSKKQEITPVTHVTPPSSPTITPVASVTSVTPVTPTRSRTVATPATSVTPVTPTKSTKSTKSVKSPKSTKSIKSPKIIKSPKSIKSIPTPSEPSSAIQNILVSTEEIQEELLYKDWEFRPSSESHYYNYQSLFPPPEIPTSNEISCDDPLPSTPISPSSPLNQILKSLMSSSTSFAAPTHVSGFLDSHGAILNLLPFLYPSQTLYLYHAFSILVFLSQYFTFYNVVPILEMIPEKKILSEEEWIRIIRDNCKKYDEILQSNPEMSNFEQSFHTYYESTPTNLKSYYTGDPELITAIENVDVFCIFCNRKCILVKDKTEETTCSLCQKNHGEESRSIPFICKCCLYHLGMKLVGLVIDLFQRGSWTTYKIIDYNPVTHDYLLLDFKHKLYCIQLLNRYFYIRTKSDLYEEFIIKKKPPTVAEYETNLIEYMNSKQERRNHYCKVCSRIINKSDLLICDCCGKSFHESCSNSMKIPGQSIWFCNACLNNTFNL